jgi:hypothetical protein
MERGGDAMKKSATILWTAVAAAVLAAPVVRADDVTVKAKVPFDFQVGDRQLPSGEYRFVMRADPALLLVYSAQTGQHLATVLSGPLAGAGDARSQLAFDRHGHQLFLKSVRGVAGPGAFLPETGGEVRAEAQARAEAEGRIRAEAAASAAKTAMP